MSLFATALLSLSLATASPATPDAPAPVMRVAYSDLDLATPEGRNRFRARLDQSSHSFCQAHRAVVTPQHVRSSNQCERAMRAAALRELPMSLRRQLRTAE